MASLQNTKRRIKSVEATKKITKAMELVSSAKLRKAKELYEGIGKVSTFCAKDLASAVYEIARSERMEALIKENPDAKTIFVVIASDMGLCGGYNSNVAKMAYESSKPGDEFILIGKKTQPYLHSKGCIIRNIYSNITKDPTLTDMYYITKELNTAYRSGEFQSLKIVSTKFVNSVTFVNDIYSLIPVKNPFNDLAAPFDNEADNEFLLKHLLTDFISMNLYTSIIEARVCEYASSRMAMENATDNANEIEDELLLEYNRVRQANITQEISEIVGGADAL